MRSKQITLELNNIKQFKITSSGLRRFVFTKRMKSVGSVQSSSYSSSHSGRNKVLRKTKIIIPPTRFLNVLDLAIYPVVI